MKSAKANKWTLGTVGLAALLATSVALAQKSDDAEVQLQAAYHKQMVEGQLEEAIRLYTGILTRPGVSRAVAAKALVQMGQCYEKLGDAEARKAYERVLRDYADQNEAATEARKRLAALGGGAKTTDLVMRRVWSGPDVDAEGAPSPDGKYLSYVDWETGDLAVRDLATGEKRRLTHKGTWAENGNEFAEFSVPSPDGKQVAYAWFKDTQYELRVIGLDGSNPRTIYRNDSVNYVEPKAWSPDGKQILTTFILKDSTIQVAMVSLSDGSARILKTIKGDPWEIATAQMCLSPDGRYIAYNPSQQGNEGNHDIFLLPTDGSGEVPVVQHPADDYFLAWAPDGKTMLFASDRTGAVSAWAIEVVDGKPHGSPRLLKSDVGRITALGFSGKGSFYYALDDSDRDLYTAAFDFSSSRLINPPAVVSERFTGSNAWPSWSPDGKYIAYLSVRHRPQGGPLYRGFDTIVVRSLESGQEREIHPTLHGIGGLQGLHWSPDDRFILAHGFNRDGQHGIFRVDAQTGEASLMLEDDPGFYGRPFSQMTPDGKSLVYQKGSPKGAQILAWDLENRHAREVIPPRYWMSGVTISPDGRQIAFDTQAQGAEAPALKIVAFAGGEPRELYSLKKPAEFEWDTLAWTPDGKHLVFGIRPGGTVLNSRKVELWEIAVDGGEPHKLGLSMDNLRQLRIHPGGQRIAFEAGTESSEVGVMENLLPLLKAAK